MWLIQGGSVRHSQINSSNPSSGFGMSRGSQLILCSGGWLYTITRFIEIPRIDQNVGLIDYYSVLVVGTLRKLRSIIRWHGRKHHVQLQRGFLV